MSCLCDHCNVPVNPDTGMITDELALCGKGYCVQLRKEARQANEVAKWHASNPGMGHVRDPFGKNDPYELTPPYEITPFRWDELEDTSFANAGDGDDHLRTVTSGVEDTFEGGDEIPF